LDDGIPHGKDLEGIGTADPHSQSQAGSGGDAAGQFESARTIANILGDLTSEGTTHHTTGAKSDGVFLGDGLPPVPATCIQMFQPVHGQKQGAGHQCMAAVLRHVRGGPGNEGPHTQYWT